MGIKCCHHCTKRVLGCHSHCDEYNDELKKNRELNDKIFNEKMANNLYISYRTDLHNKLKNPKAVGYGAHRYKLRNNGI